MGLQTYLEERFLALAQGLEAYYHDDRTLREKIKGFIEPFKEVIGDEDKRCKLENEIVDTRNYLTHHNPKKEKKASKDRDLWLFALKWNGFFNTIFSS